MKLKVGDDLFNDWEDLDISVLKEKMKTLAQTHINQKRLAEDYNEKFNRLISSYNETVK
jgi:hypothetical protein